MLVEPVVVGFQLAQSGRNGGICSARPNPFGLSKFQQTCVWACKCHCCLEIILSELSSNSNSVALKLCTKICTCKSSTFQSNAGNSSSDIMYVFFFVAFGVCCGWFEHSQALAHRSTTTSNIWMRCEDCVLLELSCPRSGAKSWCPRA